MENCTPEQHDKLRKAVGPDLLLDAFQNGVAICESFEDWLALEDMANALIENRTVLTAPLRAD
jgi:hypothetical protein